MSLLGKPEPVEGWVPVDAAKTPEADAPHLLGLIQASAILLRKGGVLHALGKNLVDAYHHFEARLLEARREAAEVRYALGLPMESTLGEVLEAIKKRSA